MLVEVYEITCKTQADWGVGLADRLYECKEASRYVPFPSSNFITSIIRRARGN